MPGYSPARVRFWRKVDKSRGSCWLWVASTRNGYGAFNLGLDGGNRSVLAHRFAWDDLRGPIPEGLVLDHLCGVRRCVNPDHLEHREMVAVDDCEPAQFQLFDV